MNLNYLIDPNMQFQDRNGVNNVNGFIRVYIDGTDDFATTYKNFEGTLNPRDIRIDNNGRCVIIVDDSKAYRVECYDRDGGLLWTQHPVFTQGGGGSSEQVQSDWDEENPTSKSFIKNKPDVKKGKLHRIGVRIVQEGDPSPKPMTDWVIDLESPNPYEPDGYDRLTVAKAKEIHNNGEVFAFTSYATRGLANNEDTYYESIYNSSSSYLNIVLTKPSNHQNPTEISRAVISDYGDYLGVTDASADSEYLNVTLVQEGGDALRKNKIHRYSFGDGTVDGETPIYGSWLIDLDKPDPDGPEGYARVTPAEFWKSTAVNGEVPVYLQDKNANNSLTYAYLSRTDVTKSGGAVTSVFAYFVRSGYGNVLSDFYGFRFTKLYNSDYLQRAAQTDDTFNALSRTGNSGTTKPMFTTAQAVANIVSGETLDVMLGKIAKWFSAGFPMKNYGTKTIILPNINVDNNGYTKIVNPNGAGVVAVIINPVTIGELPNVEIDLDNSESATGTSVTVYIQSGGVYTTLRNTTDTTPSVASGKIMHISAHGMGWHGTILAT